MADQGAADFPRSLLLWTDPRPQSRSSGTRLPFNILSQKRSASAEASISRTEMPLPHTSSPETQDPALLYHEPKVETMISSIMSRLMNYPGQDLPAHYNSTVLRILESYRQIAIENSELQGIYGTVAGEPNKEIESLPYCDAPFEDFEDRNVWSNKSTSLVTSRIPSKQPVVWLTNH